ncbi:uncharacterized protein PHACADRAFT_247263 [Phanerochaete carnosa HHB-10118-sp]|uniref:Uncharacterized protein n=1 Tax=Phanerochaete carnosa (strain HHB-10118-sp) TaxID=650164 RepID=K5WP42_PHACS|nr:uncharacterized protein PHACADRAFT_247263 [Phanerochaete carnosa HHB-10118-sp]EKM60989.1 hypothetical protein PHACADRAFT_247263 [Phanerochaete carnosa HHB-10118-sp]
MRLGKHWQIKLSPPILSYILLRWLHLLDLLGLIAYLGILARYALDPSCAAAETISGLDVVCTVSIVVYCLARVLQRRSLMQVPYFIVALAFLSSLPFTPHPNDMGYNALLVALSLHILQLHLPYPPSPFYLLPFQQVLPLSLLIWNGVSNIYLPVLALFLPALLLTLVLLSLSLADSTVFIATLASPLEARSAFLLLLLILLFLLIFSAGMLILVYPSVSSPDTTSPWDRYPRSLGLGARRAFISIVLAYTAPYVSITRRLRVIPPSSIPLRWDVQGLPLYMHKILNLMTVGLLPFVLAGIFLCDSVS